MKEFVLSTEFLSGDWIMMNATIGTKTSHQLNLGCREN